MSGEIAHCRGTETFRRKSGKRLTDFEHFDMLQTLHPHLVQCLLFVRRDQSWSNFKVLSHHLPGGTEKTHKKPQ
jgi:hypothetical protein